MLVIPRLFKMEKKSELLCRGGCGFYGNPNWDGYCSMCRKKFMPAVAQQASASEDISLGSDRLRTPSISVKASSTPPASPSMARADSSRFSREASSVAATLKKTFSQQSEVQTASSSGRSSPTPGRLKQTDRFTTMLRTLPRPVSTETENTVKHFLHKLHSRTFASIDDLGDFVQKFYVRLEEKLNKNNVYLALPSQVREEMWDEVEAHVCLRLHKTVFAHVQDEEADLALHNKLRSLLKEIKPDDLELPPAFADSDDPQNDDDMKHLLDDAFLAIIDMTTKTTPQEILACLSTCCSALFNALRAALPSPPSADDFLPALIYCVIRTNPPQIPSIIAYVERFALPRRVSDGEAAYYFTNLCCAVKYLNSADAASMKTKSKKPSAADEADQAEADEKGCSVASVKADRRLSSVEKMAETASKRIGDLQANVEQLANKLSEDARDLTDKIQSACEEADKAIETQLIDFSDPPPTSPLNNENNSATPANGGRVLKLFALGTMDAEAIEQQKASLLQKQEAEVSEETNPQPLLIDFDSELPQASQPSS